MSNVIVLPCPAVASPGRSQICDCKCYQIKGVYWARRTPEGTRPAAPGCPTSGRTDRCECVGCTWDQATDAYWPQGTTPGPAAPRPKPTIPERTELPPTRSDTLCGKNRYASIEAAARALHAHAEAKGYSAWSMVIVSHPLCPRVFHIVPRSKAGRYTEVHDA